MKFEYNSTVDKQCWRRLNTRAHIFGTVKKTQKYSVDDEAIKKFKKVWTPQVEKKFQEGMYQIFKKLDVDENIAHGSMGSFFFDVEVFAQMFQFIRGASRCEACEAYRIDLPIFWDYW